MTARMPLRGTLLNTATVIVGSLIGLAVGSLLPAAYQEISMSALGLITLVIGVKLALETKNILVMTAAAVVGGALGVALGIAPGLDAFAEWMRQRVGGTGRFNEGLIAASVLFCVGPMTLLGCLKDGLEGDIQLLAVKSTLDGVASIFLAASLGTGVLVSAVVVLVVQGVLTLAAGLLRPLMDQPKLIREASAVGGLMMLGIGFGLLDIRKIPSASLLPALAVAPMLAHWFMKEEEPK